MAFEFDANTAKAENTFDPSTATLEKPASALRKMADLGLGFASGAVGATKALTDVAGAGNKASNALASLNTGINDYLSPQAKADQQEQGRIMADASGKGVWEGVKAGAKAFGVAPVQTAVQGLGSVVPIVAGTALTGGAAPAAAVGAGMGVAMGAGTAKGAIYDEIKKRGGTEEQAIQAQEYGGENTDQIALGGALGVADALTGVSKAASTMARNALGKPIAQTAKAATERGIVGRAGMGMLGEMPLEAAQGGQEQVAANLAAQRAGYEAGTWDNVASNATLEALASAGPGAAFGAAGKGPAAKPVALQPGAVGLETEQQAPQGPTPALGYSPLAGTPIVFPDGSVSLDGEQAFDKRYANQPAIPEPVKPSEAMGITPDAGPLSRVAAGAVDGGIHDEIQQAQAVDQDQAAYDAYAAQQEAEAQQQDTANQPITQGPLAEAQMSEEDKRAVLFSNQPVADGGRKYEGTQDGDILNGMGAPFKTRFAAARRAKMEGAGWTIAPVFDGFVARLKDAPNVSPTTGTEPGSTEPAGPVGDNAAGGVEFGQLDRLSEGDNPSGAVADSLGQSGEQAGVGNAAPVAQGNPQPKSLNKQVTASAGPGFTAKDVLRVENPTQAANEPTGAQATPDAQAQAVGANTDAAESVPGAGTAQVEPAGVATRKPNAMRDAKERREQLAQASAEQAKATKSASQRKEVSRFNGKYGKGMNQGAARLEATRLNRLNDGVTYAAEEHNDQTLENPYAVVGRKPSKSKTPVTPANNEQEVIETVATNQGNDNGTQAAEAIAQPSQQPAETPEDVDHESQWIRATSAEREAIAGRAELRVLVKRNVARRAWGDLNRDIQNKLAKAMEPAEPVRNMQTANAPAEPVADAARATQVARESPAAQTVESTSFAINAIAEKPTETPSAETAEAIQSPSQPEARPAAAAADKPAASSGVAAEAKAPSEGVKKPQTLAERVRAARTQTPAFKKWFGDSKVVDAEGNPLVVYHGTSASENGDAFTTFDTYASNYGLMGMGGYFTADPAVASSYTAKGRGESKTVYPAYLSIQNPIDMDAKADVAAWTKQFDDAESYHEGGDTNESWYRAAEESLTDQEIPKYEGAEIMQEGLRMMGHDGITHMGGGRVQKEGVKHRVYIAFDPEQIKSATGNNGQFDAKSADIRFSRSSDDEKSSVLSKNGEFQGWPKFNTWTRAEYNDVVSLLPKEYRDDSYRREPLPAKDWDTHARAALPEIEALNDLIGDGTYRLDSLGNIVADARKNDAATFIDDVVDIAEKHGLGIFLTGVRTTSIERLQKAGFVSEFGIGGVLQRAAKTTQPPMPMASSVYNNTAYGTMMAYKPRGFAMPMFSHTGATESIARAPYDAPSTVVEVQKAIRQLIGITGRNQLGGTVATTAADIKSYWEPLTGQNVNIESEGDTGRAQAYYDPKSDTVFLIADHIRAGTESAVLAHELMHKHGQPVLGEAGWNKLHGVIEGWKQAAEGSNERRVYDYAIQRVNAAGAELSNQELFPYAVEGAIKMGIKPNAVARQGTVSKWLASVIQSMKEVWSKIARNPETFKAQDLVNLAFGIAQRENNPELTIRSHSAKPATVAPVSRSPAKTPLYEAMRQLSRFDDAFQTADSGAKDLPTIAKEMTGKSREIQQFDVEPSTELHQGNRKPTMALKVKLDNGTKVKLLDIFDADKDRPFVVIGNSEANQDVGGATAYQIAFAWAHNNGKTMRPDPAGLTVINRLRRTEAMISSAMHFGTTKHLEPHRDQYVALLDRMRNGGKEPEDTHYSSRPDIHGELEALKAKLWTKGGDATTIANNVQHLIEASTQLAYSREPSTRNLEVADGELRVRNDREGAIPLADVQINPSAGEAKVLGLVLRPAHSGVGASTLRRAAISGSVTRAVERNKAAGDKQNSGNQSPDVAALQAIRHVLGKLDLSVPEIGKGVFYSRSLGEAVTDAANNAPDGNPTADGNDSGVVIGGGQPVPESQRFTKQAVEKILEGVRTRFPSLPPVLVEGSVGEVFGSRVPAGMTAQGASNGKEIFIFLDSHSSELDVLRTIFHELFHHGLSKSLPQAQYISTMLKLLSDKQVSQYAATWRESPEGQMRKGEMPVNNWHALAVEEALADISEEINTGSRVGLRYSSMIRHIAAWAANLADTFGLGKLAESIRSATMTESQKYVMEMVKAAGEAGGAAQLRGTRFSIASTVSNAVNSRKTTITGQTNRQYTTAQLAAMKAVGFQVEQPSLKDRAQTLWKDAGKKLAQGIADQFAPVKDLDKSAYGLLRLSKGASGAFEVFLNGGKLKITDGVYDFDEANKGGVVDKLLIPLQGEHHDFMRWVAANRAERLQGEGKENLFSAQDIADLKTLADGTTNFDYTIQTGLRKGRITRNRTEIYADSNRVFNEFNKNVLDMAEQSGLIDGASRKVWEHEFYVPFYRVADEDSGGVRGMSVKGSALRQQAFKELKGGKNALNADLLDNTLMNWAHLLDASAKNRAAKATIEAAERMGIATGGNQLALAQMGTSINNKNGVVWFMDGGQKRYSLIDNQGDGPYLMTALNALEYAGMRNPVMNAMGAMKHALTVGVTASPFFKVKNLIRDSVQAIGSGNLSYNPAKNLAQGNAVVESGKAFKNLGKALANTATLGAANFKLDKSYSDDYFRLLAGGGTIHFATMLEGSEAKRIQALVEAGVDDSTILNSDQKVKAFYRKFIEPGIEAYNELGNRGEAINRAALYSQLVKQGVNHAEASLQARDLMDFSMQGTFTTIRFLTQVVPFFNARIQGMYKLGRAAKEDPKRFGAVLGATALFSLALLAAYGDDDDWRKREEWDRNNFWWFKFGGMAFRIPKPFEIGAIGTLAERSAELAFDNEMTTKRYGKQIMTLLGDNLSMNPVPQLVKPILDVYANKDSFSGRPIETMSMERLQPEYRFTDRTSMAARAASTAANSVTNLVGVNAPSPVQIDSMLRGYFGWLGSFIIGTADKVARPLADQPEQASPDYFKTATGSMVSNLQDAPSRYVSSMYDQAKEIEQAYGTWRALVKDGKTEEAADFAKSNKENLDKYRQVERVKQVVSKANQQIRAIERSDSDGDTKRSLMRTIQERKDRLARQLAG